MVLKTEQSYNGSMRANRSSDTTIELRLRKSLWHNGIRYRKNFKLYSCRPDIVITKYRIAIFCDGDFWHSNPAKRLIFGRNKNYWEQKLKRNKERDLENTIELRDNNWDVLRFWESDIKNNLADCLAIIMNHIELQKSRKMRNY